MEALNLSIPDFQSIHIKFPFLDMLGDGYSSFAWENYLLLTSTNQAAIAGTAAYGQKPVPAIFDPLLEAYKSIGGEGDRQNEISFNAYTNETVATNCLAFKTTLTPLPAVGPWPMNFYINVTDQPMFGNGTACDQQITLYNTSVSTGANSPVGAVGSVYIKTPYLLNDKDNTFHNVYGIKVDIAFIENNFLDCQ